MKYYIILFFFYMSLTGCNNDPELPLTNRGYKYEKFTNLEGAKPEAGDEVYFHFTVMAGDSLLQDTRPQIMAQKHIVLPDSLINAKSHPFSDIMPMMTIGDSVALYYPLDSFPRRPQGLDHVDDLTYIVKVEHILKASNKNGASRLEEIKELAEGDLRLFKNGQAKGLKNLDNGLQVLVHEEGDGALPLDGEYVSVHYYGMLEEDAASFDNSFSKSSPIVFPVNRGAVIKGWDQGLKSLKKGSKATLFIPYTLAYGDQDRPTIPAKSNLVFYVELLN